MLKQVVQLELTKHKKSFFSLIVIVLLSFVLIQFMPSYFKGYADYDVVGAGMTFLVVFGIPMLAVVMGAIHAAVLRRDPEKSAEEPLPVSPDRKVLGGYLGSLIYFLLIAVPFMLCYPSFIQTSAFGHMMDNIFALLISSSWWLALLLLHLLSFALTYWLKQPIMGGGLAVIAILTQGALMMSMAWELPNRPLSSYRLTYYYEWWQFSSVQTTVAVVLITTAFLIAFRSLLLLGRKLERGVRINFLTAARLILGLFFGVFFSLLLYLGFSSFSNEDDPCCAKLSFSKSENR